MPDLTPETIAELGRLLAEAPSARAALASLPELDPLLKELLGLREVCDFWMRVATLGEEMVADLRTQVGALLAERERLREALRELAEWDETKAMVLGSSDFRLIARAALEGAPDA